MVGTLLFSFEFVLLKELSKLQLGGLVTGSFYIFFVGVLGAISLIIYSIFGGMENERFDSKDYFLIICTGIIEYFGMTTVIYAACIGVSGIAFAIGNTCCIYTSIFNYFVMGQQLTIF